MTAKRIETIIKCSKQYEDNIHQDLQTRYDSNRNLVLRAHRSCVDTYCHPTQVKRAIQRQQSQDGRVPRVYQQREQDGLRSPSSISYCTASTAVNFAKLKEIKKTRPDGGQHLSVGRLKGWNKVSL